MARNRPPARIWTPFSARAGYVLAAAALLAALGCGHATVPCPTPTSSIDEHRAEAEKVGETIGRARAEERALRARRDEAAHRAAAARAGLDSLQAGGAAR